MSATGGEEFDVILREVGTRGKFQKRMLFLFLLPYLLIYPQTYNYFFILGTPEHWCSVPGNNNTSVDQWKTLTIPKTGDKYKSCHQFSSVNSTSEINCENGWIYSKETYRETAVSYYNWVCDDAYTVPLIYDLMYAAGALGFFICGPLMDNIGRIPVLVSLTTVYFIFGLACL